uniref:Putative secreted protein n=1 Tax=Anopheles darlingi TaxID=43151 RepID=A0A2M4DBC8_ANODA
MIRSSDLLSSILSLASSACIFVCWLTGPLGPPFEPPAKQGISIFGLLRSASSRFTCLAHRTTIVFSPTTFPSSLFKADCESWWFS